MEISTQNKLMDLLTKLNIRPHISGYTFIVDAVKLIYKEESIDPLDYNKLSMGGIYRMIAENRGSTAYEVERAIRYAISRSKSDPTITMDLSNQLENSAYIYTLATYLKRCVTC